MLISRINVGPKSATIQATDFNQKAVGTVFKLDIDGRISHFRVIDISVCSPSDEVPISYTLESYGYYNKFSKVVDKINLRTLLENTELVQATEEETKAVARTSGYC